jgi:hypothetical protein
LKDQPDHDGGTLNLSEALAACGLTIATVVAHLSVVYGLLVYLRKVRQHGLSSHSQNARLLLTVIMSIIVVHGIEVAMWAAVYYSVGALDNGATALFFSLGSYSTLGSAGVVLPADWRLLGGIEGLVGALMFGLSTAFIFLVMNAVDHIWQDHQH